MNKQLLLTPGPTPVPEEIQKEMAKPIIHHRTPQYKEIFAEVNEGLKKVFKTKAEILTFASSGTGAMEASIVNTLSKGDKAIVIMGGKFGERFAEICDAYGVSVVPLNIEWGRVPEPKDIEKALNENKGAKAVFVNLCETSTATVYDIKSIGDIVKETDAILVVDAISGLGSDEFKMDQWHVDIAVGGSQKGLMIPPGLAFCAISKKAWDLSLKSNLPKYYYDFKKHKKSMEKNDVPFTPAITLEIGLKRSLSIIKKEGIDNFIERHRKDAEYVRGEIKKMNLKIFSESPSNAVTAVEIPEGINGADLIKSLKAKGITFAGGQAHLKGEIFRIAHMGGITRSDLEYALGVLKETLKEMR
ncbi:MAG: alanine--glyoxylate aminotransferase family protein [Candidatus Omnitrophica bacterium]|nr:alanine--glyoxylate aminotransferase family protein [Candidatus Omnitrophota bacterium]